MKNRYLWTALLAALTAFTIGCSSSGGDDDNEGNGEQILPTKFMIKIPSSLGTEGASPSVRGSGRVVGDVAIDPEALKSIFHDMLNSDIKIIKSGASRAVTYLVGFNAAVVQNGITPSETTHTNVKVTVTAQHIEDIRAICAEAGLDPDIFFEAGDTFPLDSLRYSKVSDGTYDYLMKAVVQGDEDYIHWSEDKSKVKVVSVTNDLNDPSISYLENHFAYDGSLKGSCFLIYQEDADGTIWESPIKLRENAASSLGGVYVGETCKVNNTDIINANTPLSGYADNQGGGFVYEMTGKHYALFDAAGTLDDSQTAATILTSPYYGAIEAAAAQLDAITTLTPVKP